MGSYAGQILEPLAGALTVLIPLYWLLCSSAAAVAALDVPGLTTFRDAVTLAACRGKIMDDRPRGALGPLTNWTVPQRWFWHFYALGTVWNALVLLAFRPVQAAYLVNVAPMSRTLLALLALQSHLTRRLLETLFLLRYPKDARMHGIAYAFSITYYLVVPLTLLPPGTYVDTWRALASGLEHLTLLQRANPDRLLPDALAALRDAGFVSCAGLVVFLLGCALQCWTHVLLAGLARRRHGGAPYRIPRGGPFRFVSCPHYLGEIVIYLGLSLVADWRRSTLWCMCFWVVSNLVLAARLTHAWYRRQFKTYPPERRALVPFVF